MDMLSLGREFFPERRAAGRRRERASGAPSGLLNGLNWNEVRILALMARDHTSKEIAARVSLAASTVYNYRARIRAKLGAATHPELRPAARAAGVLGSPDGNGARGERGKGSIGPEQGERAVR